LVINQLQQIDHQFLKIEFHNLNLDYKSSAPAIPGFFGNLE